MCDNLSQINTICTILFKLYLIFQLNYLILFITCSSNKRKYNKLGQIINRATVTIQLLNQNRVILRKKGIHDKQKIQEYLQFSHILITFKYLEKKLKKMSQQVQHHILKKYNLIKKLGSGAYGHVWKVTDKKTGQIMALKKIFDAFQHSTDAQRTFRQIVFLHELNHPNIIKLHNVIKAENDKDLYLVFQFMEADLHNAIGQKILKDIHNRFIIYQIVKGMKFLHSAQIIHRDLKPSNVLLNSDCHLKICDFGLARSLVADKQGADMILTQEVATRWYRAPQVLLGSQTYEKSADIWSIGCILGEVLIGKPLFPGNSTLNQLERIISFTGNPSKQDIYSLNSEVAISMMSSISQFKVKGIKDWFKPDTPQQAISLLSKMLQFNPNKRPTADQILRHPYLCQFHNPKQQFQSPKIIYPPVSDNKKLNLKQYRQLIYDRIRKIYKSGQDESPTPVHKLSSHSINGRPNNEHKSINKQETTYNSPNQDEPNFTPIRHSTGKMKTASYSSSCSSFAQFQNAINNNNGVNHGTYNSFYNSTNQDLDDSSKIQKKSSLKEILKNKKYKEQIPKGPSPAPQAYVQKYYKKPGMSATIYKQNKLGRHI